MATIVQNKELAGYIRVATVFDIDEIKPVWFEQIERPAAGRIFVTKVNMLWTHQEGTAKNINFAISAADDNNYTLTWSLSVVETVPFP